MAGYSYNQTTYTKSNIYIIGSELRYNPNHTANASIHYEIAKGKLKNVNIGLISQYFGNRFAGRSTRLNVPNDSYKLIPVNDYFVLDLVLGYKAKKWRCNGKLANVLNEMSYNIHDDNSVNPIMPINYSLQIGYTF
jgi:iron complex outermembrane receptor protein